MLARFQAPKASRGYLVKLTCRRGLSTSGTIYSDTRLSAGWSRCFKIGWVFGDPLSDGASYYFSNTKFEESMKTGNNLIWVLYANFAPILSPMFASIFMQIFAQTFRHFFSKCSTKISAIFSAELCPDRQTEFRNVLFLNYNPSLG